MKNLIRYWFVGLFLLIIIFPLLITSRKSKSIMQIKFDHLDELMPNCNVSPPIETAKEPICYTLSLKKADLSSVIAQGYSNWTAIAKLAKRKNTPVWMVRISSKRFIPEFYCILSFNKDGTLITNEKNFCEHAK